MLILRYAACFAAYWLVMVLSHRSRFWFRLLPHAGVYAYNDNYREYVQWHKRTGGRLQ